MALFLLAALAHPVGTVFSVICSGVLAFWAAWLRTNTFDATARTRTIIRYMTPFVLAVLPAMMILSVYLGTHYDVAAEHGSGVQIGPGPLMRLESLLGLRQLYTVDNWQIFICLAGAMALAILFSAAVLRRARELKSRPKAIFSDGLLVVMAAFVGLYMIVPDGGAGAGGIVGRLDLYPWLVGLIWLSSRPFGLVEQIAGICLVGPISIALLATNAVAIVKIQPELAAIQTAEALLTPGSTVLPIMAFIKPIYAFPGKGYLQNNPFQHMQHYAAADRGIVMLNNWNMHYWGFPAHFKQETNPYEFFDPVIPTLLDSDS